MSSEDLYEGALSEDLYENSLESEEDKEERQYQESEEADPISDDEAYEERGTDGGDIAFDSEDLGNDEILLPEDQAYYQRKTDNGSAYVKKLENKWDEVEKYTNAYVETENKESINRPVAPGGGHFDIDEVLQKPFWNVPKRAHELEENKVARPIRNIVMDNIMSKMKTSHIPNTSLLDKKIDIKKEMIDVHLIPAPQEKTSVPVEEEKIVRDVYFIETFRSDSPLYQNMENIISEKTPEQEIEMIFGAFIKKGKFTNFQPGISSTDISKIERFIDINYHLFSDVVISKDKVSTISKENIRKIQTRDEVRYEEKERDHVEDIHSLGLRFRSARETLLDKISDREKINKFEDSLKKGKGIGKTIRERDRKTYFCLGEYQNIKIDISRIKQTNILEDGKNITIFKNELEIEVMEKVDISFFVQMVQTFISVLQSPSLEGIDKTILISKTENESVVRAHNRLFYKEIMDGKWISRDTFTLYHGFWNKPRNITLNDVLNKNNHAITVKLNGIRNFVFFIGESVYLLGYPRDVFKIGKSSTSLHNTLIDGEFIVKDETMEIHVFDILFFKGRDIRNKNFSERFKILKDVEDIISSPSTELTVVYYTKEYFTEGDFYERTRAAYLKESEYEEEETDGLIYQSQGPYTDKNTLKWKQSEYMTIDFLVEDTKIGDGEEGIFKLMVDKNTVFKGDSAHPFSGTMKCKKFLDGESINHKIVECKWKEDRFVPFRIRHDRHQPNNMKTSLGNWKDIQNPIHIQTLLGMDLMLLRKFHNQLKYKALENQFGDKLHTILDIGSGRGGDLKKWKDIGFRKVYAVEPNPTNREEFMKRMQKMHIKNVEVISTGAEDTPIIKEKLAKDRLDGMVSFFSMTFFPETEEKYKKFLETIDLIPFGGKFVGMVMDGRTVHSKLQERVNSGEKAIIQNDAFIIEDLGKTASTPNHIAYKVMVDIPEESGMVHKQIEYLFDFDQFVIDMAANHFFLVEDFFLNESVDRMDYLKKKDGDYPRFENLPLYSKIFSSFNRFFVFERAYQKIVLDRKLFNPENAPAFKKIGMPNVYKTEEELFCENIYSSGSNFIECILRALDEDNQIPPKKTDEYHRKALAYKDEIADEMSMDFFLGMHNGEYAKKMYMAYVSAGMDIEDSKMKAYQEFKDIIKYNLNISDYMLLEWITKKEEISIYILDMKYDLFPSRVFYNICDVVYNYKRSIILVKTSSEINAYALVYYKKKDRYYSIFDYAKSELVQKIKREICQ